MLSENDMPQYPIPSYIAMCKPWLQAKDLRSQPPQLYDAEKWRAIFHDSALENVFNRYPQQINRLDIIRYAEGANQVDIDPNAIQELFWATMLWGWGTTGYGPKNRVKPILDANDNLFDVLSTAFQFIQKGDVSEAYEWLCPGGTTRIKNFGEAYFSKFLYFAGLGCGLEKYPLILDSKINTALNVLIYSNAPRAYARSGYLTYVDTLHQWAQTLECRADSIEYLLFMMPPGFWMK
jgi:hypothetical protein